MFESGVFMKRMFGLNRILVIFTLFTLSGLAFTQSQQLPCTGQSPRFMGCNVGGDHGFQRQVCVNKKWVNSGRCIPLASHPVTPPILPTQCVAGGLRYASCRADGIQLEKCVKGKWSPSGACLPKPPLIKPPLK